MDLETENRIAVILMKEAAELRKQAEKEGVGAYLQRRQPKGRPNSRFLTATVLGVQQANKAVEVNEMWRVWQKERELDERLKQRSRDMSSHRYATNFDRNRSKRHSTGYKSANASCSPSNKASDECHSEDGGGLRDEEIEVFLHSRVKRGRGAVGSRMDETGPCFPEGSKELLSAKHDVRHSRECARRVLGLQKPALLNHYESSSIDESDQERRKKATKVNSRSSHKQDSRKHRSSKDKDKKKKEEKRSRHRKR